MLRYKILFLLCCFMPCIVSAQISVTDVITSFKSGDRPVKNVTVGNSSEELLYVTAEPVEVINPGGGKEERVKAKSLLVSPSRFSVQGKGKRTVRILLRERPKDMEKVYRISYIPQAESHEEVEAKKTDQNSRGISIKVLTGVGMLIFAEPSDLKQSLQYERSGETVTFKNTGNTNVRIRTPYACKVEDISKVNQSDDESQFCEALPPIPMRLYPGMEATAKLPFDKALVFTQDFNEKTERIVVMPND